MSVHMPVWLAWVIALLAIVGFWTVILGSGQWVRDRLHREPAYADDDDQDYDTDLVDLDDDRNPVEALEPLPPERSWQEITGEQPWVEEPWFNLQPATAEDWPLPEPDPDPDADWLTQLLGGHTSVEEAVESMWTRAAAKELAVRLTGPQWEYRPVNPGLTPQTVYLPRLTGKQAKRARHKARHAAKREQVPV